MPELLPAGEEIVVEPGNIANCDHFRPVGTYVLHEVIDPVERAVALRGAGGS